MNPDHVTVVYKWTAHPGMLDRLTEIYADVTAAMERDEPDAETVHVYVSESENALYVRDEFKHAGAVGFHLSTTAAGHFASLLEVASPGPFFFLGPVPDEMKAATAQMGLAGEFGDHVAGFDRTLVR